jgi:hypothetical protein
MECDDKVCWNSQISNFMTIHSVVLGLHADGWTYRHGKDNWRIFALFVANTSETCLNKYSHESWPNRNMQDIKMHSNNFLEKAEDFSYLGIKIS